MIRTAIASALAALALMPAAAQESAAPEPAQVVAILAHPDDEIFMAPAVAALAREGKRVRIVHATPGDAGPGFSGLPKGAALGTLRRAEADCSGKALGVAEVVNLGFGDGVLADHVRDGSLAKALAGHVAPAALVLTWGADGGYGHSDHRLVSAVATQIAQAMPAPRRPKLLYVGIPAGRRPPVPAMADWAETDPALLGEAVAYAPADLAAANAALQCHQSQFDAATRAGMMPLFDATIWRGRVHFRAAF